MNTGTCMSLEVIVPFSGKGRQSLHLAFDHVKVSELMLIFCVSYEYLGTY